MKKILRIMVKIEEILAMLGIGIFTLTIFLGAITRCFGHPLNWTATVALFVFVWTTFLCGNVAFYHGRLVNLDLVVGKFPKKVQKVVAVVVYAIIIAFIVLLIYQGIRICQTTGFREFNGQKGFSYFWAALSIPVCFSLMLLTAVERLYRLLKSGSDMDIAKM